MLVYTFDNQIIEIREAVNGNDMEFTIRIVQEEPYLERFRQVEHFFNENGVISDVFFYPHVNHEFQVIVRSDYYADFVLELMKRRLLKSVEWTS
jgi:endo-1,4-beta-mannosidase